MPADDRFLGWPVALVTHILGSAVFALVGAVQFVPAIRRRHPGWHRRAGRALAVAGLMVAGSALWLTLFYDPQPGTGPLLYVVRLVVAPAMAGCLVVGALAARRRCIACCHSFLPLHLRLSHGAAPTPPARRHGQAQGGPRACRPVVPPALPAADPRSLLRSTACCCSRARSRAAAAHCTSRSTTSSSRLSILPERPTSSGCVCAPCRCTREPL